MKENLLTPDACLSASGLYPSHSQMTIPVPGAAGYLGSHTLAALLAHAGSVPGHDCIKAFGLDDIERY